MPYRMRAEDLTLWVALPPRVRRWLRNVMREILRQQSARPGKEYLSRLPAIIPTGRVLVHNHVRPARRLGTRGFRAWLQPADRRGLVACRCEWAAELGKHFTVAGIPSRAATRVKGGA
jgi:hypothetical protein